ncbi:MAG TPA: SDR family oxidoreductase [Myxococcota bacterium]|jgi:NAD(P)-dependent dehydrogenase (short-subunit alcohol dehydrogenase family)
MTDPPAAPVFSIAGRIVLVTGAGRGIGRALATGLGRLGARVHGMDVAFAERASGFEAIHCDVGDEDASARALREIVSTHGRLDGLVNNAGISLPPGDAYGRAGFERTLGINTLAPLRLSWTAAELMKRHASGSIVNVTSLGAHLGFPDNPAYQASKAALLQVTRAMAVDYGRFGIRVNSLCPGYVKTAMTRQSWEDESLRLARSQRMILPRWAEPEDLVGPCAFLLSDAAGYITGIDLPVDGGWRARGI